MSERRSTKHRCESSILLELQRDHGYMFAEMDRERDRGTTQVRIRSGKLALTPARVLRAIVPIGSWLAIRSMEAEKRKKSRAIPRKRAAASRKVRR